MSREQQQQALRTALGVHHSSEEQGCNCMITGLSTGVRCKHGVIIVLNRIDEKSAKLAIDYIVSHADLYHVVNGKVERRKE